MFTVKLKDGTVIPATSVEESYRPEHDGQTHIALTIQNSSARDEEALDALKAKLTKDALSSIQVFLSADDKTPAQTYTGYQYIRYLTNRLQPDGKVLLDMNFTKENLLQT